MSEVAEKPPGAKRAPGNPNQRRCAGCKRYLPADTNQCHCGADNVSANNAVYPPQKPSQETSGPEEIGKTPGGGEPGGAPAPAAGPGDGNDPAPKPTPPAPGADDAPQSGGKWDTDDWDW